MKRDAIHCTAVVAEGLVAKEYTRLALMIAVGSICPVRVTDAKKKREKERIKQENSRGHQKRRQHKI